MNQSSGHKLPSFFITDPMPCPYIEGQYERKLFTHMAGDRASEINENLTHAGFRRSQTIAYRPACDACSACQSVRVNVPDFVPSKSFRRILKRNSDLTAEAKPPQASREQYDLLRSYLDTRHKEGGMADMTVLDFIAMVEETAIDTQVIEYRDPEGKLEACVLVDAMSDGISLVYSFYNPHADNRSLGSFIILDQIARAKNTKLQYVYLGYLIEDCEKMNYKSRFQPLESLKKDGWQPYHRGKLGRTL